jgi:hypothetical protein
MTMTEYNSRDPYGEAVDSLVDDVAFAKAEREGRVEYVDDEPADDPTAWEATHHEPDAGHQYDDTGQAGDGFTAGDAAGFLADVRDNWHSLDPADQQEASELAGALLAELGADLRAQGYDDTEFYAAFTHSGGDLHAALAVVGALGQAH